MFSINSILSGGEVHPLNYYTERPEETFEPDIAEVNDLLNLINQDNNDMAMMESGALPQLDIPDPCAQDELIFSPTMRNNMAALEQLVAPIPQPQPVRYNILANIDISDDEMESVDDELERLYMANDDDDACSIISVHSSESSSSDSVVEMENADQSDDCEPIFFNPAPDPFRFNIAPFLTENVPDVYEMYQVPRPEETEDEDDDMVYSDEDEAEDQENVVEVIDLLESDEETDDDDDMMVSEDDDDVAEDSDNDIADDEEEEEEEDDGRYRVSNGLSKWKST